jgi:hypothetical protein
MPHEKSTVRHRSRLQRTVASLDPNSLFVSPGDAPKPIKPAKCNKVIAYKGLGGCRHIGILGQRQVRPAGHTSETFPRYVAAAVLLLAGVARKHSIAAGERELNAATASDQKVLQCERSCVQIVPKFRAGDHPTIFHICEIRNLQKRLDLNQYFRNSQLGSRWRYSKFDSPPVVS